MGIIAAAKGEHPLFDPAACLNRKQNKFTCTACTEICPEKVFSLNAKETLKWDKCIDCGLCLTACPSRCFTPSGALQHELLADVQIDEPVIYGCEQDEELLERKLPCLASVPWELAAALALYTDVVFLARNCAQCPHAERREMLAENLQQLREFLGEERFTERVHVVTEGEWKPKKPKAEKLISRREVFSGWKRSALKSAYRVAASRLPVPDETEKDGMQYRRMLSRAVRKEREREKQEGQTASRYTVELPKITAECYGCSICERICPQKAVSVTPEENGTRTICIAPWKCTACGLCTKVCPYGGADGTGKFPVPYLEELPLAKVASTSCERCGIAVKPGTEPQLCPACAAKAKKKLR